MSYSKETFKRKSKNDLYLIKWEDSYGKTYIVAITNDLDKWLELNNSERQESEQEELDMFNIEQIETHLFEEIK